MLRKIFTSMFNKADRANRNNILRLASKTHAKNFLDLGCDNGDWTLQVATAAGNPKVSGVEIIPEAAARSQEKGIDVKISSLDNKLPYPDASFDMIRSWHNIFAAILGWQTFSLTSLSRIKSGIGNPLAIHRGHAPFTGLWTHKVIFNYRGLKEFLEAHGFENVEIVGAGYYPLPNFFSNLDPRHSHFITARAVKPQITAQKGS